MHSHVVWLLKSELGKNGFARVGHVYPGLPGSVGVSLQWANQLQLMLKSMDI